MTTAVAALTTTITSTTKRKEKKLNAPKRGRSVTVRNPKYCTNAACNIHDGEYETKKKQKQKQKCCDHNDDDEKEMEMDKQSSDITAFNLADHFALFGNSTVALVGSLLLLVVAVAISLLLESDTIEGTSGFFS